MKKLYYIIFLIIIAIIVFSLFPSYWVFSFLDRLLAFSAILVSLFSIYLSTHQYNIKIAANITEASFYHDAQYGQMYFTLKLAMFTNSDFPVVIKKIILNPHKSSKGLYLTYSPHVKTGFPLYIGKAVEDMEFTIDSNIAGISNFHKKPLFCMLSAYKFNAHFYSDHYVFSTVIKSDLMQLMSRLKTICCDNKIPDLHKMDRIGNLPAITCIRLNIKINKFKQVLARFLHKNIFYPILSFGIKFLSFFKTLFHHLRNFFTRKKY
ncbi:hypothetical protein KAU32_07000 [bacterium]|nr:hypothetical protein [bacterium]